MRPDTQLILGLYSEPCCLLPAGLGRWRRPVLAPGGERHAMSHHGGHTHADRSARLLRHLLKNKQELGLTDEQITKMRGVAPCGSGTYPCGGERHGQ